MTSRPVRFDYTPLGSPVTWIAGPIVAGDNGSAFCAFGSGFLAAPNLAFTARHVVDEISKKFTEKRVDELVRDMPFAVQLATTDVTTGRMLKWNVTDYHYSRNIDIAGLSIEPAEELGSDFAWVLPRFDMLVPVKGSTISAFGYPDTKSRSIGDDSFRITLSPRTTEGIVKEIHYEYRDRGMLHFPCLNTNARFDAGMSGGPVFSPEGRICAMVCSNLPPREEGQEHDSHASLIWPAFGLRFNQGREAGQSSPRFLRSEAEAGRMQVFNLDHMTVEAGNDGDDRLRWGVPRRRTI